ncbi:prion-inhibition and propagation-domain-containing protein, partial [Lophiotrema nucula]
MAGHALDVAPLAFKSLTIAWRTLDDTLSFPEDSQDLELRLETTRAHLTIWAHVCDIENGVLRPSLVPFDELIGKALNRIWKLLTDVEQRADSYGLVKKGQEGDIEMKPKLVVAQMRRSLHRALASSKPESKLGELVEVDRIGNRLPVSADTGLAKQLKWGVKDKKKFEHFVVTLETHVNGLHKLLPETERRGLRREETRFGFQVVHDFSDLHSLSQLQNTSMQNQTPGAVDVAQLAQWKAITLTRASSESLGLLQTEGLTVANILPINRANFSFTQRSPLDPDITYLFEKKEYDTNISDSDKDLLKERIRKLIVLLKNKGTQRHLHTLQPVDHLDDPEYHCWWIVFRFPLPPFSVTAFPTNEFQPLNLLSLYASRIKPPLELRYRLAKRIAGSLSKLFGSDWMHKSINSSNIIYTQFFSFDALNNFKALNTALIQGFGYSRQHTEAQTIDRGKVLRGLYAALYRHPNYQGEAASGYKIHHDIYSLGLVLFEIANWSPLSDMLTIRPKIKPPVDLYPGMKHFHQAEASELKRRVMIRVELDLPYRVGSKYAELVKWCLNLNGPVTAIEFYNEVTVPLEELC